MGCACTQAHLRGDLWLPLLWLFLFPTCCSHDPPGWRFTSSEIVIPRKVSHRVSGIERQGQLSYKIRFSGQRHMVHLRVKKNLLPRHPSKVSHRVSGIERQGQLTYKIRFSVQRHMVHLRVKKNLLPRHFPVITDNDQSAMQENYPYIPQDCYYFSYIEGVPGSMGTLDTCYGGLRGMLQLDDFTYEIKPLEASSKFEHLISQLVTQKTAAEDEKCEAEEKDTNQEYEEAIISEMPRAGPVYLWWPHRKALKVHYTVSHSLVVQNSNETHVIENVVIINNILHTIYYQGQLQVFIRALCIWSHRDQMNLQRFRSPAEAKAQFGLWKSQNFYANIPHDTSLLLTGHKIAGTSYYSSHNGICDHNRGASYVYVVRYHIFLAATVGAHGIGLMGAFHNVPGCWCFRRYQCLMAPNPGLLDMISNCTFEAIHQWLHVWEFELV